MRELKEVMGLALRVCGVFQGMRLKGRHMFDILSQIAEGLSGSVIEECRGRIDVSSHN
jgi:hypothetical protein